MPEHERRTARPTPGLAGAPLPRRVTRRRSGRVRSRPWPAWLFRGLRGVGLPASRALGRSPGPRRRPCDGGPRIHRGSPGRTRRAAAAGPDCSPLAGAAGPPATPAPRGCTGTGTSGGQRRGHLGRNRDGQPAQRNRHFGGRRSGRRPRAAARQHPGRSGITPGHLPGWPVRAGHPGSGRSGGLPAGAGRPPSTSRPGRAARLRPGPGRRGDHRGRLHPVGTSGGSAGGLGGGAGPSGSLAVQRRRRNAVGRLGRADHHPVPAGSWTRCAVSRVGIMPCLRAASASAGAASASSTSRSSASFCCCSSLVRLPGVAQLVGALGGVGGQPQRERRARARAHR